MQKQKSKNINFESILLQKKKKRKATGLKKYFQTWRHFFFFVIRNFLLSEKPDFFDSLCILLHAHKA